MRRDHLPYYLRRAREVASQHYARRFLHPHFDAVGQGTTFARPQHIRAYGGGITLGRDVHITADAQKEVIFGTWPREPGLGTIHIGDFTVINPGARFSAGVEIRVGKNAIFATDVYVSDSDWHGTHDRVYSQGGCGPVVLEDNVWVGERVVICKDVTIGENSIIGAGSVVVKDIPKNSVAAGNPARVVRPIDPSVEFVSREHVFQQRDEYFSEMRRLERNLTAKNSLLGWLRYKLAPRPSD